jgi:hypothetical protein
MSTALIAEIKRLAAQGLGYEDIAIILRVHSRNVRPFVIGRQE